MDLIVFGIFKKTLLNLLNNVNLSEISESEKRIEVYQAILDSVNQSCTSLNIKSSFSKVGLHPIDFTKPFASKFIKENSVFVPKIDTIAANRAKYNNIGIEKFKEVEFDNETDEDDDSEDEIIMDVLNPYYKAKTIIMEA